MTHTKGAARGPDARDDGAPEAAGAILRAAVDQVDGARRVDAADRVRGVVVAVVDEDDLDRQIGQHPLQPGDERPHVLRLLAGREHDRDRRRVTVELRPGRTRQRLCRRRDRLVLARPSAQLEYVCHARLARSPCGRRLPSGAPANLPHTCRIHIHVVPPPCPPPCSGLNITQIGDSTQGSIFRHVTS